jgi:hypothetical protein
MIFVISKFHELKILRSNRLTTTEDEDGHKVKKDWGQLKTEIDERIIDKITDQLATWGTVKLSDYCLDVVNRT